MLCISLYLSLVILLHISFSLLQHGYRQISSSPIFSSSLNFWTQLQNCMYSFYHLEQTLKLSSLFICLILHHYLPSRKKILSPSYFFCQSPVLLQTSWHTLNFLNTFYKNPLESCQFFPQPCPVPKVFAPYSSDDSHMA
jgi:hypothetical protein